MWKARTSLGVVLRLAGTFVLHSISVQESYKIDMAIVDSDLLDLNALNLSRSLNTRVHQWMDVRGNSVRNTILKAMLSPEFERMSQLCVKETNGHDFQEKPDMSSSIMVTYGFERQDWMSHVPLPY